LPNWENDYENDYNHIVNDFSGFVKGSDGILRLPEAITK
jgi:hypothetical protein